MATWKYESGSCKSNPFVFRLQTSRRRTKSFGRLWLGEAPSWSRVGGSVKLWGWRTTTCRSSWSTAARKSPSCRILCTPAKRSCTGMFRKSHYHYSAALAQLKPECSVCMLLNDGMVTPWPRWLLLQPKTRILYPQTTTPLPFSLISLACLIL